MAIGLSHGGTTIYSSPSRSNEILVATTQGVVIIERDASGHSWHVAHRGLTDRHISAIVMEPESGLIFAGAFHGSLHVSDDGGRTWKERSEGLSERNVYSVASVRMNGKTRIYAGTEPAHLFYSDDLGLHWTELPSLRSVPSVPQWSFPVAPHIAHLKQISFDPYNPTTMYASIEVGGLLKSTDAGETWEELHGMDEDVHRLVIHPTKPKHMYVVSGVGLYVTSDGGATWEQWTSRPSEIGGYPDGLVFHPDQPELMFIGASQNRPGLWRTSHFAGARISRSRDGGRTWEVLRNGLPDRMQANIEALCLENWGESVSVFAGTTAGEVYGSDDGGEHWSRIVSGLAPISKGDHYRPLSAA
ncbi:MAG: glycosyl hydrolase [Deltaproteobacteria bacterium]|nr:glycosyl hydrolase [Deltaproteobacteria bacterium]